MRHCARGVRYLPSSTSTATRNRLLREFAGASGNDFLEPAPTTLLVKVVSEARQWETSRRLSVPSINSIGLAFRALTDRAWARPLGVGSLWHLSSGSRGAHPLESIAQCLPDAHIISQPGRHALDAVQQLEISPVQRVYYSPPRTTVKVCDESFSFYFLMASTIHFSLIRDPGLLDVVDDRWREDTLPNDGPPSPIGPSPN